MVGGAALTPIRPVAVVGAFVAADPSLRSGQALDVPDNRRIFVAGQGARPVAEGVSRALALPAATVERPLSRQLMAILNPSPSSPSRLATGTSTSARLIQPVEPARTPSLPWIWRSPSMRNA